MKYTVWLIDKFGLTKIIETEDSILALRMLEAQTLFHKNRNQVYMTVDV